jgi:hypothetical protein
MSAAYSIIRNAHKKGLKILGAGCYSAVLETKDPNTVIKVGADIFDPYLYYAKEIMSKQNKHFPKIKKLYIDNEHGYYIVYLEKLFEMQSAQLVKYQEIYDWAVKEEAKPQWVDTTLDAAVNTIVELADYRSYAEIVQAKTTGDILHDACRLDLHESNVMCRNDGTFVFADPLCNYEMYDVPEVEEWLDHELGVTFN